MATHAFSFAKRQRQTDQTKRKEQKRQRKLERRGEVKQPLPVIQQEKPPLD